MTSCVVSTFSYFKQTLVAITVVLPVSFGLNLPLNYMTSSIPIWGLITINAIVISSYMFS